MHKIITTENNERYLIIDKITINNSTFYLSKHIKDRSMCVVNPKSVIKYEKVDKGNKPFPHLA